MVSVIIPLYNKKETIVRAVRSILNGTVQPDEVIVVDDGSTDGSADALKEIFSPLLRVITQENGGVSAARNRGIREARGDMLAFLDADDEWMPGFLETVLALEREFPGAGLYGTAYVLKFGDEPIPVPLPGLPAHPWRGILTDLFALYLTNIPFNSDSVLIPKAVFEQIGGFAESERIAEDVQMWLRIFLRFPVAFTTEPCTCYHQDAPNRAYISEIHAPGYARWLDDTANTVPAEMRPSVIALREHVELGRLISLVKAGQTKKARVVYRAFPFKVFRKHARMWAALSLLPRPVFNTLMSLRQGR